MMDIARTIGFVMRFCDVQTPNYQKTMATHNEKKRKLFSLLFPMLRRRFKNRISYLIIFQMQKKGEKLKKSKRNEKKKEKEKQKGIRKSQARHLPEDARRNLTRSSMFCKSSSDLQLPPISPEIHHPRKECLALIYDSDFNRHTHIG